MLFSPSYPTPFSSPKNVPILSGQLNELLHQKIYSPNHSAFDLMASLENVRWSYKVSISIESSIIYYLCIHI